MEIKYILLGIITLISTVYYFNFSSMVNDNQFDYGIDNNQKVYVIDLGEDKSEPK